MADLHLKSVPDRVMKQLQQSAAAHRRSIEHEAVARLESSVEAAPVAPLELLRQIDALQHRLVLPPLDDDLLNDAIAEGRP